MNAEENCFIGPEMDLMLRFVVYQQLEVIALMQYKENNVHSELMNDKLKPYSLIKRNVLYAVYARLCSS